jgi:hypothetical protein
METHGWQHWAGGLNVSLVRPEAAHAGESRGRPCGRELGLVAALLLAGLCLRVLWVGATPLHPDEIHYAWDALAAHETGSWSAVRDIDCDFLVERRSAHPMLASLLTRWLWIKPLGGWAVHSPGFLRGFSVVCGALLVVVAWGAARTAWGVRPGLVAAGLVATNPLLVWVSRTLYLDAVFLLFIGCFLWAVACVARRPGFLWPTVAGVLAGCAGATKISAPLLGPVVVLAALLGPVGMAHGDRFRRAAVMIATALATWVLFCSPTAYVEAILHPSDRRYPFIFGGPLVDIVLDDTSRWGRLFALGFPLTTLLGAAVGAALLRVRRTVFDGLCWLGLVALAPLFLLHLPSLSGPHGLTPIVLVLSLLASRAADLKPPVLAGCLLCHVALCAVGLFAPAQGPNAPFGRPSSSSEVVDFRALRPYLFAREPRYRIAVAAPPSSVHPSVPHLARNAILAEGAVVLVMAKGVPALEPGPWALCDVVIAPGAVGTAPPEFRRVDRPTLPGYEIWIRTSGRAAETVAVGPLPAANGYYPISGHLTLDGERLPRWEPGSTRLPALDGFRHAYSWGTGMIYWPDGREPGGLLGFEPPDRADVFWGY